MSRKEIKGNQRRMERRKEEGMIDGGKERWKEGRKKGRKEGRNEGGKEEGREGRKETRKGGREKGRTFEVAKPPVYASKGQVARRLPVGLPDLVVLDNGVAEVGLLCRLCMLETRTGEVVL